MTLKARWLWPLLLTLLGFSLRLYQIDKTTFRGDEATTIQYWMLQPLSVTIPQQLTEDPHPILAYALYRGWGLLVGQTPLAARMLSALAGTLAIPLMIRFAQHITRSRWIAWISGFLWAIHPYLIWHSQDARNYALWSTASLAALWFAVRALDRDRPKDWLLYIGVASIAAYIYYLEAFMLGALSLFVLVAYWHQRRMWW
ncbi:MAG: glycosyltransferase family 39 protein, partial [Phototrophicaceae bacterium]